MIRELWLVSHSTTTVVNLSKVITAKLHFMHHTTKYVMSTHSNTHSTLHKISLHKLPLKCGAPDI